MAGPRIGEFITLGTTGNEDSGYWTDNAAASTPALKITGFKSVFVGTENEMLPIPVSALKFVMT
jgi:hypothetical protein